MGNTHLGLEIRLVFIIFIFLAMMAYVCVGVGNLTKTLCSMQERLALLKFKQSVRDDQGMLSSWGVGDDCCMWERIGCDDVTGRVVSLHLRRHVRKNYVLVERQQPDDYDSNLIEDYLVGYEVNSCLIELVNLKHLDLSGNDFQKSRIPEFIGSFEQLRYLNLSSAGFSGYIPHQIGNLSNLKVLVLGSQELMTHDIAWISGLSKLEHLDLSGVDLNRAENVDILFYTFPSLLKLSLSRCRVSTAYLDSHHLNSSRELANIKHLDLSGNDFKGKLPRLFLNMTSIVFLDLSRNNLSMAWSFGNLIRMIPSLLELRLSDCMLQKIHLSPTNLNSSIHFNIRHLDLSVNAIEGIFPSVLTNMSSLLSLDLSANWLNSSIPIMPNLLKIDISNNNLGHIEDIGIWSQCHLKELIASNNNFDGEMIGPSTNVSKCSKYSLEILNLDENALSGPIPEALGNLRSLRELYMSYNLLNGSIPESFGRLTSLRNLDLWSNKLRGPIPENLGDLSSLQGLYLNDNQLNGSIPESLGKLINLRELYLSANGLTGQIPKALGNLKSIQALHLSNNQLIGCIPESLGSLTDLEELFLVSNWITGSIPVSFGRLASLRIFSMSSNLLDGFIPDSFGQLTQLQLLDVSNNSLHGVVSEEHFANLSMLKELYAYDNNKLIFNISRKWIPPFQLDYVDLGSCKIEGGFPRWVKTQRKLEDLLLSNASLYGPLPTWLRLMTNIINLDVSHNKLTGPLTNLPPSLGGKLFLQDNLFTGLIPRGLCKMASLQILHLSKNRLTGKIPKCLWGLSLRGMLLGSNRLSGAITSSLGSSPSLMWLQLNDNNFNGELPLDFGYYTDMLIFLDLGENEISGSIPQSIGENFENLNALRLHKNNLTGRIPDSLCKSEHLQILDLAHNNLGGSIPNCFGKLYSMKEHSYFSSLYKYNFGDMIQVLKGDILDYTTTLGFVINMDLSSNKLVGEIPEALTALDAVVGLNLSYNHFSGGIPKDIGKMKSLISLDLSANNLTGMIPPSMTDLNFLSYLNLSHNNLSGQIPKGNQLQTLTDASIYADNTYLCGAPLPKECSPCEKLPSTKSKNKYDNDNERKKVWFYLDITCGFATGFWGIIGVLYFKKHWRHKLFMIAEVSVDKIYVAVAIRVLKMKRGRDAA